MGVYRTIVLLFAVTGCRREPLVFTCETLNALTDSAASWEPAYLLCPEADGELIPLGDVEAVPLVWVLNLVEEAPTLRMCEREERVDVYAVDLPRGVEPAPASVGFGLSCC